MSETLAVCTYNANRRRLQTMSKELCGHCCLDALGMNCLSCEQLTAKAHAQQWLACLLLLLADPILPPHCCAFTYLCTQVLLHISCCFHGMPAALLYALLCHQLPLGVCPCVSRCLQVMREAGVPTVHTRCCAPVCHSCVPLCALCVPR